MDEFIVSSNQADAMERLAAAMTVQAAATLYANGNDTRPFHEAVADMVSLVELLVFDRDDARRVAIPRREPPPTADQPRLADVPF